MRQLITTLCLILLAPMVMAAKLAIVIDDFGYRPYNEHRMILLSPKITVAVLPHSQHAQVIANFAHQQGNEVIIHLPMAPISQQKLEKNTLYPNMTQTQIAQIIEDAIKQVPYAIGVNNHMGSLMTANLDSMKLVMQQLQQHQLFFLDSRTIANSQVTASAKDYQVPILMRNIFLDDALKTNSIAKQFDLAIAYARKHGQAIAIGHPHPQTVAVMREKLAQLPADIELVSLSELLPKPKNLTLSLLYDAYKNRIEKVLFESMIWLKTQPQAAPTQS